MVKRKQSYTQRFNKKETINLKLLIWLASIFGGIVILVTVLLIIGR